MTAGKKSGIYHWMVIFHAALPEKTSARQYDLNKEPGKERDGRAPKSTKNKGRFGKAFILYAAL
jgi:hypothetical protein